MEESVQPAPQLHRSLSEVFFFLNGTFHLKKKKGPLCSGKVSMVLQLLKMFL